MGDTPKFRILALAKPLDLSESYGALLHLTALMESDPATLVPESEEEQMDWQGHLRGLHAALRCLVMQERQCRPHRAAAIVDKHIAEAAGLLGQHDDPEIGE